jgi:tripartite-type tricarboxylate transporter receptor subunit TctC
MKTKRKVRRVAAWVLGTWLAAGMIGLHAQTYYPTRAVRIVVPSTTGGGTDTTTRLVAAGMSKFLGQQVVVENRAGAAMIIGSELVARAAPDGYTLLAGISTMTINPHVHKSLPYDAVKDFAPISQFVVLPNALVGHPSVPAQTLKELIAFLRARPNQLQFGSAGVGSNLHLCMELFLYMTGVKMVHMPYRGAGQAVADLTAGYLPFMVTNMITASPLVHAGRLRAYGVTSAKRSAALPEVPTLAEAGVPGYEAVQWYGLLAPAGTPRAIIAKLHESVARALQDPATRKRLIESGAEPIGNAPAEFARVIQADLAKWGKIVTAAGIKAE